ncbi:MAG: GMC family oxidoreductase N-terminal domain-containing protein [Gaiellaceae bacterium]
MTLTDRQGATLRTLCDTVVPRIERADDPTGFWARTASDVGVPEAAEEMIGMIPDDTVRAGLVQLLDVLGEQGLGLQPSQLSREQVMRNLALASPDAAAGLNALVGMTLFLNYGAPDPQTFRNPNWDQLGYPGPISPPPQVEKPIRTIVPDDGATYEADVVVVGSGAGGGVIAGTLAQRGLKVIVIEASGYFNESDFAQLELKAYQEMYWRGGPTPTADGNVTLQAGTTLGGGTTINWTNCLRTTDWVREQWAREFGLEGVDGPEYDAHLDAVLERIGANDRCSDLNGPQERMKAGCEALGWDFRTIVRNADPERYNPEHAGYLGFGEQSGAKLSGDRTFLLDAFENGAELVVRCRAQRVITEGGRAAGVEAVYTGDSGTEQRRVVVRAPRVVIACGALESPALLLRSDIGGPAVGNYLRLHPALAVMGRYGEDQRAWWGTPQAGLSHEFANTDGEGYGLLVEAAQYAPALIGSAIPWTSGLEHKETVADSKYGATLIALIRDRGHGRVEIDHTGEAVPWYDVADELDMRHLHQSIEALSRIHHAAGAAAVMPLASGLPMWRIGDDLERFVERCRRLPLRAGGVRLFSAHQMGTCRMGRDPQTSVANPWGELHDTPGVWVGDGSAFPTASGTNPMVSIMALARRTAHAIAGVTAGQRVSESEEMAWQ